VVLRTVAGIPSLRRPDVFAAVRAALVAGSSRFGMRIVHFSVQGNHIHLISEARRPMTVARLSRPASPKQIPLLACG